MDKKTIEQQLISAEDRLNSLRERFKIDEAKLLQEITDLKAMLKDLI